MTTANTPSWGSSAGTERLQLASAFLHLEYDPESGRASLFTAPSQPLVVSASAGVALGQGLVLASEARYIRHCRPGSATDLDLSGAQLQIHCHDSHRQVDLDSYITLLHDRPGAIFELTLTNVSPQPLVVPYAEPLRALLDERSGCFFGTVGIYSRVHRVLRQGYLYSDPGEVVHFAWQGRRDVTSWWHAAFQIPSSQETLIVGYIDTRDAEGQILAAWDMSRVWHRGQAAFDLTARSLYQRTFIVPPGRSVSAGRCLALLTPDPYSGLEQYAELCGRLHRVRPSPILHGWCSWFYTHTQATEDEQLHNAAFIAQHLKPYGMQWVQIDDGYQRAFGDWDANDLYPHGMAWLAAEIRRLGLRPGIWIAPYAVSEHAPLVQAHPEWLAHDATGHLQTTASTRGARYILDITHPGARQWLRELVETMVHVWGYDFIKIDFVEWTLLAIERYYDPTVSRAQAYRLGMETIRAAMGPQRHLLDCGPGAVTVGLIDSMRIEQDLPRPTWEQYVAHSSSTAPAVAKRYYFHRRMWINDADHLCMALLSLPQAQAVASLIALSGGTVISGDRLYDLDAARLAILTKVLPTYGAAARPLDLFTKDRPELFALYIQKDFGSWWLLGYFNWDEGAAVTRDFALSRLGLETAMPYLVYDFWEQRLLAETPDMLPLHIAPASVRLLAIRAQCGVPQVIGTDRHYTQGAVELAQVHWDAAQRTLSGIGLGAPGLSWGLTIYVPEGFTWDKRTSHAEGQSGSVSVRSDEERLLQVRLQFGDTDQIHWAFTFSTPEDR
jgi:hypothetical protein